MQIGQDRPTRHRRRIVLLRIVPALAVLVVALLATAAATWVWSSGSEKREQQLTIRGTFGPSPVELEWADAENATSPVCGCFDSRDLPLVGVGVPSTAFSLAVQAERGRTIDERWQLTGYTADPGPSDWFSPPVETLRVEVRQRRRDGTSTRFSARATHFVVLTSQPIDIRHGDQHPYLAVLPAAEGSVALDAPTRGGIPTIRAGVPERAGFDVEAVFADERLRNSAAVTQRGAMLDVLGPRITMTIHDPRDVEVYAGLQRVTLAPNAGMIELIVDTSFSLRLQPGPAPRAWTADLPGWFADLRNQAEVSGDREARAAVARGPRFQGRAQFFDALPEHTVRLDRVMAPSSASWSRFAALSGEIVDRFIPASEQDELVVAGYRSPSVSQEPAAQAFGALRKLRTSALRGLVSGRTGGTPVTVGQDMAVQSGSGLSPEKKNAPMPLLGLSGPADPTSLSGRGVLTLDGSASWDRVR